MNSLTIPKIGHCMVRGTRHFGALRQRWSLALASALLALLCATPLWAANPQVAVAGFTSMALDANGNLFGWGDNGSGLLGRLAQSNAPNALPGNTVWVKGFAGNARVYLIDDTATLWGAGYNQFGQLGDGTFFLRRTALVKIGTDFQQLAVGSWHTLGIKRDGSLWTWGDNTLGQLGEGTYNARPRPTALALGKVMAAAAGAQHSLVVLEDQSLWAWGSNSHGQLGDGSTSARNQPVKIGDGYKAVAAGEQFSAALRSDNRIVTWGRNGYGQLGHGGTTDSATPQLVPGTYTALVATANGVVALGTDNSLWFWGQPLSASSTIPALTPTRLGLVGARAVSAGAQHVLVQIADGSLYALGSDESGVLGAGDDAAASASSIVKVSPQAHFFAAGGQQSLIIDSNGRAYVWGSNSEGQLGLGRDDRLSVPVQLASGVRALSLADRVAFVVKDDSSLWGWGENGDGRLGDGSARSRPNLVRLGDGYASVSSGNTQTFAIKQDGSLWAWGANDFGQLGLGDTVRRLQPTKVGDGFSAVAAGAEHTLALKHDGSLWSWGRNRYGQLGNGSFEERFGPQANAVPTKIGDGYSAILAGAHHSLALKTDGSLWAWGWNEYGQVGNDSYAHQALPVQVASAVDKLLSASINSVVLGKDGKTYAWGYNGGARFRVNVLLAGRDFYTVPRPSVVSGNWISASVNDSHGLYLRRDGHVFSVGYQQFGQLGDGSMEDIRSHFTSVLGAALGGLLDLMPAQAKELKPGDIPPVLIQTRRQGNDSLLSLGVRARITMPSPAASTAPRTATTYQVFVVAVVPVGTDQATLFVLQPAAPNTSPAWAGLAQPLVAYLQDVSASETEALEFDVLENLDMTQLPGAVLYLGYGTTADEMIASQRYRVFYSVPAQ